MRVTRESLIRIAKETAQERAFNDRDILAAYLTGSLVSDHDPMIGGTADIDLVFVHTTKAIVSREVVKLTPDFHLDISHRAKSDFKSPRELRTDPWLGYEMYDPMLLYQREKFFEFVQAGLRAGFEFHAPALVLGRCRKLMTEARKGWIDLSDISPEKAGPTQVRQFLRAVSYAGNTIAELTGGPLAERRFLLDFPARAQAAELPDFTATMFNLIGASHVDASTLADWLPGWRHDFLAASEIAGVDQRIHSARLNYYEKAIQALLEGEMPLSALWPLIHSWTLSANALDSTQIKSWQAAAEQLGLLGSGYEQRVAGIDQTLDAIEVHLDQLAAKNGLETSTSL
ncbi:MAG TPA: hypothetical protein VHM28_04775 [Anaerolineales bacterium]|nr:hypothetical protein [Anaerolineales bacterium]